LDKTNSPRSAYSLGTTEWEVLYLLHDALDQLRKLTLSFSELRYLAVEHTEDQVRAAVTTLLTAQQDGRPPLIVQIPNLANLPIYRITPVGRDLVKRQKSMAGSVRSVSSVNPSDQR
jgi:hypothetical protein